MAFVDIDLDLQISICTYLHPSDILTLRKTCKALQLVTRQRAVWVDALRRVCLENTLFLPSFPIPDMSDVELEQAAIAPRRWIELCTSFSARELSDPEMKLSPTTTRIIENSFETIDPFRKRINKLVLVPGGRYMVGFSWSGLRVWDLGCVSSADCKLIASVGPESGTFYGNVHATPDGMGLVILSYRPGAHCSSYEIYPQSESPQLTEIASLDLPPSSRSFSDYISPDKIVWFDPVLDSLQETIFRVWDYRLNASVSFLALVNVEPDTFISDNVPAVVATQTAIVILYEQAIDIMAIPPLLPQPPNFDDYNLTQFPPAIRVKFPDASFYPEFVTWSWKTTSSWYFDPSKPLYFDKVYSVLWHESGCSLQRFKLIIQPDFSDATLHFINAIQLSTHGDIDQCKIPFQARFCEDTLLYNSSKECTIYAGSTLSRPTLHADPSMTELSLAVDAPYNVSICPASGRLVHTVAFDSEKVVVLDFLPH